MSDAAGLPAADRVPDPEAAARKVVAAATAKGLTVASAESLTAGMVCSMLATVPGASAALQGGVVAYQNEVKAAVLGVDPELLARAGSVDADVARQMAEGARRTLGADVGIATTGVAGPEAHDGKGVGTVFIGVANAAGSRAAEYHFDGGRAGIRFRACTTALELLLRAVEETVEESTASR
jgi:nicotinamide-nucleotide amidase